MTDDTILLGVVIVDNSDELLAALSGVINQQRDLVLLGVAEGVDDGVDLVRRVRPDVVVLDVNMPDGGGVRAAREMKAAVPDLRIIAFSAFDKALIRKTMTVAGATAYVSKAASVSELLTAIRAAGDSRVEELSQTLE